MTTEEALRVIYQSQGRNRWNNKLPLKDTEEGLAEFARLLVWAWKEFGSIECSTHRALPAVMITDNKGQGKILAWLNADTPQEAFIMALSAALVARKGGGEVE
jgi:hypothetical protein